MWKLSHFDKGDTIHSNLCSLKRRITKIYNTIPNDPCHFHIMWLESTKNSKNGKNLWLLRIFGIKKRTSFECRLITLLFIWKKIEIFIITWSKTKRRWRKKEREEHQRKCICGVSNETSHLVAAKQNTSSFFSSCIPPSVSSSHSALFPTFHPHLTPHCFSILYF